jgi:alpha-mannosidase
MLSKLIRFENTLEKLMFEKVGIIDMGAFQTDGSYHNIPDASNFKPCKSGDSWSGEGSYCWFLGEYIVPEELQGKTLFIYPKIDAYEGLLWVNGKPFGNFSTKEKRFEHGNHYCNYLKKDVAHYETLQIAIEYYASHYIMGTQPFQVNPRGDYRITYHEVDICVKNELVWDTYFNLKIVNQMVEALEVHSFRRASLINALKKIHEFIYYDYENIDKDTFYHELSKANEILNDLLKEKNSSSAPFAGLIGHSHMDTAWLWEINETVKKCARTYANQMNLMEQYPDYKFVQSSSYHSAMMKEFYPELFEDIRNQVAEGKYEPNGGVWIECDCNIPSGETMIRQFLWGQRFTRENFNYTSDTFWLPDTFGYSTSLPQIMQGCGVKYFLTTKLAWGDTTEFPYDTFYWKGLDGTKVLVHFNRIHCAPDPMCLSESINSNHSNSIKEKTVTNRRLISYGAGDGGGGPEFEMIEIANRLKDVEGVPRTGHITVSEFMQELEDTIIEPSVYSGELYLELHRGTLTNQHTIKRNNRLAEIALRNLEYVTVRDAIKKGNIASGAEIHPLMNDLLVNQFHDILPGTCIPKAHEQSIKETTKVIEQAEELMLSIIQPENSELTISVINTLSFDRKDIIYMDYKEGYIVEGDYKQQIVRDLDGVKKLAIMGVTVPAFASVVLKLVPGNIAASMEPTFVYEDNQLETPLMKAVFNDKGYIESYVDKCAQREMRGEGYALNTFLIAEDVSNDWDNWDIDADYECKFRDSATLITRAVVADGEVEFRIRSEYQLTPKSTLKQDMIFYADSTEVRFETIMNWQDDHRFLKTAFDTTIHSDFVRQEVQFGYIKRSTNRNTAADKAKFEVSNHKYTDISETRYGVAVLNDCKYGVSVKDSQIRLSLHKGGCRPDYLGDKGEHACCYSLYPHEGDFGVNTVIKPAYQLNHKSIVVNGSLKEDSLVKVGADNIIIEAVKPCEDEERSYILRLYEAEGTYTHANLVFGEAIKGASVTNMLEEVTQNLPVGQELSLKFRAFEIITLKITY